MSYTKELDRVIIKLNLLITLQRLGLLNRPETISLEDSAWYMKQ
jgi:hypothetical protein